MLHGLPAVQVLAQFTKSDRFGLEIVVPANYTFTEPPNPKYPNRKVPANDTILYCAP